MRAHDSIDEFRAIAEPLYRRDPVANTIELTLFVCAEGLALLSLGLLLSTRLSGITGGVIALVAWLMGWIGGVVGDVGTGLDRDHGHVRPPGGTDRA